MKQLNKTLSFIMLISLLLFGGSNLIANTYYVDCNHPSANDSNPGTIDLPWLTIQHAAETLIAGDTVFIRTGVYSEQVFTTQNGNANEGYIVFSAYQNEVPVLDGTGVTSGNTGIIISNGYIKIIGLEIRDWETGIWMEYAEFIELSDCEVHECFYGIGLSYGTHDFVLNRVLIHHFDLYGFDATPESGLDCYNGVLNDCISHTGRDPQQNVDGFALGHGTQQNFVFNRCITYNVYDGFDISSRSTTLNSCLAYDCWNGGYKLWQDDVKLINCIGYGSSGANVEIDWDNEPGKTTLFNCTFYNGQTFNVWVENPGDTLFMYNCILAGGDNIGLAFELPGVSNYHGDFNLFHNDNPDRMITVAYTDEFSLQQIQNGDWTTYSGQDSHSIVVFDAGTIFLNMGTNDLHLSSNSPAVDVGTAAGAPSDDFDGNPRPSGSGFDMGAYEYQTGSDVGDNLNNALPDKFILFQNYPNPFNPTTKIRYSIPSAVTSLMKSVQMKVYDILGREIAVLINEEKPAGYYEISFDASGLPTGVYFYRMNAGSFVETKKMLLIE
jgi:hypothetical protein